jgi:hypothetical protein
MVKSLDPHDARSPPVSQDPSVSKRFWIAAPILTRPFQPAVTISGLTWISQEMS